MLTEPEKIFEDDHILVVNKPNNLLVHKSHYARNITGPSLTSILREENNLSGLTAIHRLDRKTSGLLLFGKNKESIKIFSRLFEHNQLEKTYYAIVRGHTPLHGKVDTPVKRDDNGIYKEAHTVYQTMNTTTLNIPVTPYQSSRYSFIKLIPKTGRMHQLRKHMNKISHPIIGDHKYGDRHHNRMFQEKFDVDTMLLHAKEIRLLHPITKEKLFLEAPFPANWNPLFNSFNW